MTGSFQSQHPLQPALRSFSFILPRISLLEVLFRLVLFCVVFVVVLFRVISCLQHCEKFQKWYNINILPKKKQLSFSVDSLKSRFVLSPIFTN